MYRRMIGGVLLAAFRWRPLCCPSAARVAFQPRCLSSSLGPPLPPWRAGSASPPKRHELPAVSPGRRTGVCASPPAAPGASSTSLSPQEDHWLPPDNFQENPKPVVAHRTSPTNIGLYCLPSFLPTIWAGSAYAETIERLEKTFDTLSQMELFRGHFYNWYETDTLRPLEPKYVSSVDSGNLAGHLLALSNGCRELVQAVWRAPCFSLACRTASRMLARASRRHVSESRRSSIVTRRQLTNAIDATGRRARSPCPRIPRLLAARLADLRTHAQTVADIAHTFAQDRGEALADRAVLLGGRRRATASNSHLRDAQIFSPWTRLDAARHRRTSAAAPATTGPPLNRCCRKFRSSSKLRNISKQVATELVSLRDRLFKESPADTPMPWTVSTALLESRQARRR